MNLHVLHNKKSMYMEITVEITYLTKYYNIERV